MSKNILIVEDEEALAKAIQIKLTGAGYNAQIAQNGQKALDLLEGYQPDLILLDLLMPHMDGYSFMQSVKDKDLHPMIIVTSNLSQEEDIQRARDLGASDFIVKADISLEGIVNKVTSVLGGESPQTSNS